MLDHFQNFIIPTIIMVLRISYLMVYITLCIVVKSSLTCMLTLEHLCNIHMKSHTVVCYTSQHLAAIRILTPSLVVHMY